MSDFQSLKDFSSKAALSLALSTTSRHLHYLVAQHYYFRALLLSSSSSVLRHSFFTMSGLADEADEIMMCCAGCGIAGIDDIKLKECTACKSVQYCSVKCQREHRPKHKRQCKKRAAELRDEMLFKQRKQPSRGLPDLLFASIY